MRLFTIAITWVAGLLVVGLAFWFLWASRQGVLQPTHLQFGAAAVLVSFMTLTLTIYMRHRVGMILLDRGDFQEAIAYSKPRCTPTLTVGRDEAAANRYAAAEALRRQGHPGAAMTILESESRPPRSTSLQNLLTLARAQAYFDLERPHQSSTLLAGVQNNDLDERGKEHAEHLRSLLQTLEEHVTQNTSELSTSPSPSTTSSPS